MPNRTVTRWAPEAAKAHRKYRDVPTRVLLGLVETESSGQEGQVSSANAKGLTQFIPGTADAYHVNTNPGHAQSQLTGAAHYLHDLLRQTGSIRNALVRYSGGATAYPSTVLSRAQAYKGVAKRANRGLPASQDGSTGTRGRPGRSVTTASVTPAPIPQAAASGLSELLASQIQHPGPVMASPPPEPTFSARKNLALPSGYAGVPSSGAAVASKPSLADQLSAISQAGAVELPKPTVNTKTTIRPGTPGTPGSNGGGRQTNARRGAPTARLTSVGPLHETSGLAGFPAHDYFAPAGSAAVAPVSGRIVKLSGSDPANGPPNGPHGPFGWSVYVRGTNGKTYYLTHMGSRNVRVGDRVKQGQKIGTVGNYAKWGGANHIHQGVHG